MKKSTANILLNGERMTTFPLESEKKKSMLLSSFLFNIILEFRQNDQARIRNEKSANRNRKSKTISVQRHCVI